MTLVAAAVAGATLGVRHALETDHVAAVATLVDPESDGPPGLVGVSWGVGHAVPIVVLSLAFLAADVRVPEPVVHAVEGLVGVLLVAFGARMLSRVARGDLGVVAHAHPPAGSHTHHRLGTGLVGRHRQFDRDSALVGLAHGVAGSGVLVVAVASTAASATGALAFLAGFVLLSILTMATAAHLWARSLATSGSRALGAIAGALSVGIGLGLVVDVGAGLL